jgi:GxxExxY protein
VYYGPATDLAHGGDITYQIIGLAMRVYRRLGAGLVESVYEACLCHELRRSETPFQRQVRRPVLYDDARLNCGYVADIIVRGSVLLELKFVERMLPLHEAQLLSYLRLTTCRIGLLINCNTVSLTDAASYNPDSV